MWKLKRPPNIIIDDNFMYDNKKSKIEKIKIKAKKMIAKMFFFAFNVFTLGFFDEYIYYIVNSLDTM